MVYQFVICGAQYRNPDGTSRQVYIHRLEAGETLKLVHDSHNRYSEWAIQVCDGEGNQIGYVPEAISERVHRLGQDGRIQWTRVRRTVPLTARDPHLLTVVVEIEVSGEGTSLSAWADSPAALDRRRADECLAEQYLELLEEILLDGVITEDEERHASIFASGMLLPALRAVHGRVYRKALGKAVLGGNVSDEEVEELQTIRGLLARLGYAP